MATAPLVNAGDGSGSTLFGKVHTVADTVAKLNGIVQAARLAAPYVRAGIRLII